MAEYIEREALKKRLACSPLFQRIRDVGFPMKDAVIDLVERQPTADVVEVRHGKWVLEHETYGEMKCSICGKQCPIEKAPDQYDDYRMTEFYIVSPYCPYCGAKMDGKEKT